MFRVFFFFFFCFAKGKEGQSCSPHCEVRNAYHIVKLVHDIIFLLLLWLLDLFRSLTKKMCVQVSNTGTMKEKISGHHTFFFFFFFMSPNISALSSS